MTTRAWKTAIVCLLVCGSKCPVGTAAETTPPALRPNFIVILCDNLGYGDVGCFGSQKHRTPSIDRLAAEGLRLTDFYASSGVCTPSRASLMTGCYPRRVGLHKTEPDGAVLRPVSPNGLHPAETTLAEILKTLGYATACVGKWHLGDQPLFLPTRQGFDCYFGIPYSDDMTPRPDTSWPPLPLMRNERVIEAPVDRNLLTRRYTEEAIRFIEANRAGPFFLFLSHAMPGSTASPFASERFRDRSANGPYGDSVEEIDWSTGEILAALKRLEIDESTLVIWTSDNGAPRRNPPQGSNAPLRGWGYTTAEGGMRVPCLVRWPGKVPAGQICSEVASTMDLLPTFAKLAGSRRLGLCPDPDQKGPVGTESQPTTARALADPVGTESQPTPARAPADPVGTESQPTAKIDGRDIWPLLSGQPGAKSPHEAFYYYHTDQLQAVRAGRWKLYLPLSDKRIGLQGATAVALGELYDLVSDLGETTNLADAQPQVVERLLALADRAREDLGDGSTPGKHQRPVGRVADPKPQLLAD